MRVLIGTALRMEEILGFLPGIEITAVAVDEVVIVPAGRACRGIGWWRVIGGGAVQGFADYAVAIVVKAMGIFVGASRSQEEVLGFLPSIEISAITVDEVIAAV